MILRNKNNSLRFTKEITNIINITKQMFNIKSRLSMVRVEFLGPISADSVELNIETLEELSEYMLNSEELKEWATNSAVAVNDEIVTDLKHKLKDGDRVSILPPVCGG